LRRDGVQGMTDATTKIAPCPQRPARAWADSNELSQTLTASTPSFRIVRKACPRPARDFGGGIVGAMNAAHAASAACSVHRELISDFPV
jgi:hypothetical protein